RSVQTILRKAANHRIAANFPRIALNKFLLDVATEESFGERDWTMHLRQRAGGELRVELEWFVGRGLKSQAVSRVENLFPIIQGLFFAVVGELQSVRRLEVVLASCRRRAHVKFDCAVAGINDGRRQGRCLRQRRLPVAAFNAAAETKNEIESRERARCGERARGGRRFDQIESVSRNVCVTIDRFPFRVSKWSAFEIRRTGEVCFGDGTRSRTRGAHSEFAQRFDTRIERE